MPPPTTIASSMTRQKRDTPTGIGLKMWIFRERRTDLLPLKWYSTPRRFPLKFSRLHSRCIRTIPTPSIPKHGLVMTLPKRRRSKLPSIRLLDILFADSNSDSNRRGYTRQNRKPPIGTGEMTAGNGLRQASTSIT